MQEHEQLAVIKAINNALDWLISLTDKEAIVLGTPQASSVRIYHQKELKTLPLASRRLLLTLEQQKLLSPQLREKIIHHIMELNAEELDPEMIEDITRIVLNDEIDHYQTMEQLDFLLRTYLHDTVPNQVH